jgi:hypothetical protein
MTFLNKLLIARSDRLRAHSFAPHTFRTLSGRSRSVGTSIECGAGAEPPAPLVSIIRFILIRMHSTEKIRALNDALRAIAAGNGRVYVTAGIAALPMPDQVLIMWRVRDFSAFTPDNDPWGEHDFGSFDHDGKTILWKIEYYSPDMQGGSEDPADPAKTTRVLTIMRADEY